MKLSECVSEFVSLLTERRPLQAMDRFYADEVCVFENRKLARAGKAQCLAHEREQLASSVQPPQFKLGRKAIDEAAGHVFLEYTIRFFARSGEVMRVEEVAVQTWERGRIVEERFYYEGVVAEGGLDE